MSAKVSVVTGYYNRRSVLRRTITSILEQSYDDLELLVFDDASKDGTADELARLADELDDPRLRFVVHERNLGFVTGLRQAISQTTGEYIAIQGSGDVSLPGRIRLQSELLDGDPGVGVVGCHYANVVEATGARRLRTPDATTMDFERLVTRGNVFSHGEVMLRRSFYEQAGGYRTAFTNAQDYDLWLRMIRLCRFSTVPEHLYDRYIQFDGVSYDPKKLAVHGRYSIIAQRVATLPPREGERLVERLRSEGPLALVTPEDPKLQKKLFKGSVRSAVWGAYDDATEIARSYITGRLPRVALLVFAALLGRTWAARIRAVVFRLLGVEGGAASVASPRGQRA
ncbi:glycosyltransferase [Amnibacterium sp. CER49]|uniref:glycosyltransferase n=1 Tax=Amnibacterium sp. CER49 TaxID=3039161 RepID=UPI002446A4E1|nr:glycosyltransferase [Amnibacterium sp. CER49]MDH2443012.1 glycosyltransferase [Amnibacterium sp. CER49]